MEDSGSADPLVQRLEQGSFRDRDSRVFYRDGGVYRGLSAQGLRNWERLASTRLFRRYVERGKIVRTERVEMTEGPVPTLTATWEAVLQHEVVPFVSYPYEWPFGMLKDAALLQLELLAAALDEDMLLKDATPYNVQWIGTGPVFIDIPSFVQLEPGEPWPGYRQFCELFLYPLFLQAYKDVPFHSWLRGSIDGIPPEHFRKLLSLRDLFRPGVLLHVKLHALLQARHADERKDVRRELRASGFHKELIQANVKRLTKLVGKLRWKKAHSVWADYARENTYDEESRKRKADFVRAAVSDRPRRLVWDLGCNTGDYSRLAADHAETVVAMDADHLAIELLYRSLKNERYANILPLVVPLADPSPDLGWRGAERRSLSRRGSPDLVIALALIHHLVIANNIPLAEFVESLAAHGADLVIEFVTKADPMVQKLLRNKEDKYADYELDFFEQRLGESFRILRREETKGGQRILYFARPSGR